MKTNYLFLFLLLFEITFISCNDMLENDIIGLWIIDEITYEKNNIKPYIYLNMFETKKNHTCTLPVTKVSDIRTIKSEGNWKLILINSNPYILINTENELFNDTFKIEKVWEERDTVSWGIALKMILSTKKLHLKCTRSNSK